MTEDEIKKTLCPFRGFYDAGDGLMAPNRCVASGCAMWEPYEYWVDKNGKFCPSTSADAEGVKSIKGGDCGLKSKGCEC